MITHLGLQVKGGKKINQTQMKEINLDKTASMIKHKINLTLVQETKIFLLHNEHSGRKGGFSAKCELERGCK
jgi:hypothetical protein